jgi:hypothetical protein
VRDRHTKRPVLRYAVLFSVSCLNCTNCARIYLDFLTIHIKNSVKELNNPRVVFLGI